MMVINERSGGSSVHTSIFRLVLTRTIKKSQVFYIAEPKKFFHLIPFVTISVQ